MRWKNIQSKWMLLKISNEDESYKHRACTCVRNRGKKAKEIITCIALYAQCKCINNSSPFLFFLCLTWLKCNRQLTKLWKKKWKKQRTIQRPSNINILLLAQSNWMHLIDITAHRAFNAHDHFFSLFSLFTCLLFVIFYFSLATHIDTSNEVEYYLTEEFQFIYF